WRQRQPEIPHRRSAQTMRADSVITDRQKGREKRSGKNWCPERDLNPHALRLRILSPVCLPISSSGLHMPARTKQTYCEGKKKAQAALFVKLEAGVGIEPA